MATEVTPLQPVRLSTRLSAITAEERYWKTFTSQLLLPSPHSSPVTSISHPTPSTNALASPTPEMFAVTSGTRVQIYSSRTRKLLKTINRFNIDDTAHSGTIRRDGRLLLAGGDSGAIQAFDINSRAILKTWKEHKQPVWCTRWHPSELTTCMSTSDDTTVRLWDLPTEESTHTFYGHQDYVRSGCFMPGGQAGRMLVSGSYDQTVRLWDPRTPGKSVMVFKHAAPVETVLPMPGGTMLLAAADNQVSVLDLVGAKPLAKIKNHQKTVTSLAIASGGTRVLTGALDGHVKVFETSAWNVVAGFKYPSPILSLDVIGSGAKNEDKHVAVGLQSGLLSIRTRLTTVQKKAAKEREREMQALIAGKIDEYDKRKGKLLSTSEKRRMRGKDYTGEGVDIVIEGEKRGKIKNMTLWERYLRRGQYDEALDTVLDPNQKYTSQDVYTLLTTLRHRSALRSALSRRDEKTLQPILRFLTSHLSDPRFVKLTTDVSMVLLDMYSEHMGLSPQIDDLVERMHEVVRTNAEVAQQAWSTIGMLDLLMVGSQ